LPFETELQLNLHYDRHKNEFVDLHVFNSSVDYGLAADQFMNGVPAPGTRECRRSNGQRVRFNRTQRIMAIEAQSGFLKTFHRPSDKNMRLGYFKYECARTDVT
jgi:hypothetical protein